jgi:transaldolase
VSLEGPNSYEGIMSAAEEYHNWGDNVVIKVPMLGNGNGLRAVRRLRLLGIKTNVTACMTLNQSFLAARAGATYVSLFYNRMKDMVKEQQGVRKEEDSDEATQYALETISDTMNLLNGKTKLIVGSIRKPEDIMEILRAKPDIITIPTKILRQMPYNSMTERTLKEFEKAWEEFLKHENINNNPHL